ncbi:DUF4124 domain-containing protein [Comamonas odontotermitis]|uniref:DUF4124 domain-containing protein n=1 Tax=Comamonas odontotermitis TaxID=379895 RepID=UPI001CC37214|nr:DUF4124 domain-containing protein [Comamonas odontotermitis]UBB16944.1 DUF4124 domain-containing protein [Comamonas odontotermitis]
MTLAGGSALASAHAGAIYQYKQSDGKVAFQETPCATSATQTQINQHQRPDAATKATRPGTPPQPAAASRAEPAANLCVQAGRAVHARLQQTHPQAAFNACRKELAELATNMECVQACMDTWVAVYKERQASQ